MKLEKYFIILHHTANRDYMLCLFMLKKRLILDHNTYVNTSCKVHIKQA